MAYPSTLSTFSYPNSTDKLNSPSHSAIENAQSSAIGQIETVLGQDGGPSASTLGTIIGDIRNPSSDGGGHVQSAEKGGTGQTAFTKGDVLVGQSSSVISKLAVGPDGSFLKADSSKATGLTYSPAAGLVTSSLIAATFLKNSETSIISTTIGGSVLGTANALRATVYWTLARFTGASHNITAKLQYGGQAIGSVIAVSKAAIEASSVLGRTDAMLINNGAANAQRAVIDMRIPQSSVLNELTLTAPSYTTSSVESSVDQTFGMTMIHNTGGGSNVDVAIQGVVVEKIS